MTLDRQIAATEFRAKCLKLLDDVASTRESLTITKHGHAVARLVPIDQPVAASVFGGWERLLHVSGDIINVDSSEEWAAPR